MKKCKECERKIEGGHWDEVPDDVMPGTRSTKYGEDVKKFQAPWAKKVENTCARHRLEARIPGGYGI